ncbi:hypothetical protein [Sphingobacterium humi]|uniref:Uncharacterized protein n=1 Tax=Sphingobacterium humi TaxID=1796905 RepID=A0A6N8L1V0_9SPHI|nr:hypothetical protein [Sphingobacterium humi]MVZ62128.1 hypothetical protein [Sphingobacterium humi]
MKRIISFLMLASAMLLHVQAQQTKEVKPRAVPAADVQIKVALQAAPTEFREGAKVYGYSPEGKFVTLREGTNGYICLAPDYKMSVYYAYCYPESLDPFMARGRELTAEGKRKQRDEIREAEFKAGKLKIPQTPSMLYGYWGPAEDLNPETGEIKDAKRRYVIYVPYAKAADYGMSNKGNNIGMPWLMDEGTYKAHIMITPPLDHQH